MDGAEQGLMQLLLHADRFQRVEGSGKRHPGVVEDAGHPFEHHVPGQLLRPGIEFRLHMETVRTAIPEEFQHLDLATLDRGRLRGHFHVVLAPFQRDGGGTEQQQRERKNIFHHGETPFTGSLSNLGS